MVQVVLRDSNELRVRRVGRFVNERLIQTILWEAAHLPSEFFVESRNLFERLPPVGVGRDRTGWPVLRRRLSPSIPGQSPKNEGVVAGEMQDELPDAVRARYGMRRRLFGRYARQGLQHGGAMPRLSPPAPAEAAPPVAWPRHSSRRSPLSRPNTGDKLRGARTLRSVDDESATALPAGYHASLRLLPRLVSFIALFGGTSLTPWVGLDPEIPEA